MKALTIILAVFIAISSILSTSMVRQFYGPAVFMKHYNLHKTTANQQLSPFSFEKFILIHFVQPDDHDEVDGHYHDHLPVMNIPLNLNNILFFLSNNVWENYIFSALNNRPVSFLVFINKYLGPSVFIPPSIKTIPITRNLIFSFSVNNTYL